MHWIAIALAIGGNLGYHLSQKSMRTDVDPWLSLTAAYAVAFAACCALYLVTAGPASLVEDARRLAWPSVGVGLAIVGIEIGFLLAYRWGWRLNTASLLVNLTVAVLLIPIARLLFAEGVGLRRGSGIVLALIALVLLASD